MLDRTERRPGSAETLLFNEMLNRTSPVFKTPISLGGKKTQPFVNRKFNLMGSIV